MSRPVSRATSPITGPAALSSQTPVSVAHERSLDRRHTALVARIGTLRALLVALAHWRARVFALSVRARIASRAHATRRRAQLWEAWRLLKERHKATNLQMAREHWARIAARRTRVRRAWRALMEHANQWENGAEARLCLTLERLRGRLAQIVDG